MHWRQTTPDGMAALAERLEAYMVKAVREAKEQSSWSNPNADYEAAVRRFVRGALDASRPNPFLAEFHGFVASLARPAAITSLAQLVLKLTVPGVPDIYQGGELWDFSLVDPDNRRPVDWAARHELLRSIAKARPADLAESWQDGREKLFVTQRLLVLRRSSPGFSRPATTSRSRLQANAAAIFAPSLAAMSASGSLLPSPVSCTSCCGDWGEAEIVMPAPAVWEDVFTRRRFAGRERLRAAELFAEFPVSALIARDA